MKRTQSLAAAVSVAFIATGVATASTAAPLNPLDDLLPLGVSGVEEQLRGLGLNPEQILEVTTYLALDPGSQRAALAARGITVPEGDLTDSYNADFILGQYLVQTGQRERGIVLQLGSGKLATREGQKAIDLGQSLKPEHIEVSATEVEQQASASGLEGEKAALRARLQRAATMLRPHLANLVPGLAAVWVDQETMKIVISTAPPAGDVVKALNGETFAGLPIEVRLVRHRKGALENIARGLQQALAREAPKAKVTIAANPATSQVRLIPADAASAKAVQTSKLVAERVKSGDAVVEPVKKQGPSAVIGGIGTQTGNCTWGFSAFNGSNKFLTTAGHCVGEGGYPYVGTYFAEERWQGAVDAARHGTDPYFYNLFDNMISRSGLPDLEITSRTTWGQTDYLDVVCHQGNISGHSCGYVTSLYTAPSWVPASSYFVLVEGPTLNEQVGDSGGPWFYGNSAYGIHSGGSNSFGNSSYWGWGVYGAVDFAESNVHFTVMTK